MVGARVQRTEAAQAGGETIFSLPAAAGRAAMVTAWVRFVCLGVSNAKEGRVTLCAILVAHLLARPIVPIIEALRRSQDIDLHQLDYAFCQNIRRSASGDVIVTSDNQA